MKLKTKETQMLEQRWELLKFELKQLESFYNRCNDVDAINLINDIQKVMREG